jgi:hypothetical protein
MTGSSKTTVRFNGILHGEGGQTTCTIEAIEVSLPGAPGVTGTTNWSIVSTSEPVPDGTYELLADRKILQVRRANGVWLSAG